MRTNAILTPLYPHVLKRHISQIMESKELELRLVAAKRFLNSAVTTLRTRPEAAHFSLSEIGSMKDRIHEVERKGMRNLSDMDTIRIQRLLTSVEAVAKMSNN